MDVYLSVLKSKKCSKTFSGILKYFIDTAISHIHIWNYLFIIFKTTVLFTESQLLAICIDLFMAGSETTSKALDFCFLYLILFPNVQKKAQEEIDKIIGHERFPSLADRSRYTNVDNF